MYMSSQLKFKEQSRKNISDVFDSDENGDIHLKGRKLLFEHFTHDQINSHLRQLQEYAKKQSLHIKGYVTIAIYKGNDLSFENIKVSLKTLTSADTNVKVMSKNPDAVPKKAMKTLEEKIALVKKFYHEKGRLPSPNDVYETERIGTFLQKMKADTEVYAGIIKATVRRSPPAATSEQANDEE